MADDPRRDALIAAARTFQGVPYALPPDGVHTLDCSLFVLRAFEKAGLSFTGVRTAEQIRQACTPIAWSDVQAGDLLYAERTYDATEAPGPDGKLATHIGISLGAGSHQMIDANDSRGNVGVTYLSTPYWQEHLFEARRVPQLTTSTGGLVVTDHPHGVDVAVYQGRPAWPAVARSGMAFAITKATQSTDYVNPTFGYNWSGIGATNMIRGAYHFGRPDLGNPEGEADFFLATVTGAGSWAMGDLLALDLEEDPQNPGNLDRTADLPGWCLAFLRHVESKVGFKPLLYSNPSILGQYDFAARPEIGDYGLWLASYRATIPAPPAPWNVVAFWQFSSESSVPGIAGDVDEDLFNGSVDRLPLYGYRGPVAAPPPPAPSTWRDDLAMELARHTSEVQRIMSGV